MMRLPVFRLVLVFSLTLLGTCLPWVGRPVPRALDHSGGMSASASRSAAREVMPSLGNTWYRWVETVLGERKRRAAISLFVWPAAASRAIWRCCGVSEARPLSALETVMPVARSSPSARTAHGVAPSR